MISGPLKSNGATAHAPLDPTAQRRKEVLRRVKGCDFSREVLIFGRFTFDSGREVFKSAIATSHFMVCFEASLKKGINFMVCFEGGVLEVL